MKKTVFFVLFLLFLFVPFLYAGNNDSEIDKVLFSAESLFKAMKEKELSENMDVSLSKIEKYHH